MQVFTHAACAPCWLAGKTSSGEGAKAKGGSKSKSKTAGNQGEGAAPPARARSNVRRSCDLVPEHTVFTHAACAPCCLTCQTSCAWRVVPTRAYTHTHTHTHTAILEKDAAVGPGQLFTLPGAWGNAGGKRQRGEGDGTMAANEGTVSVPPPPPPPPPGRTRASSFARARAPRLTVPLSHAHARTVSVSSRQGEHRSGCLCRPDPRGDRSQQAC